MEKWQLILSICQAVWCYDIELCPAPESGNCLNDYSELDCLMKQRGLKCFHLNVWGLWNNLCHITELLTAHNDIDIFTLSETHIVKNLITRSQKSNYFIGKIKERSQSNDIKGSWSLINSLLGRNKKMTNVTELIVDDVSIIDDRSIAESMNEYFISIGTKLAEIHCDPRY